MIIFNLYGGMVFICLLFGWGMSGNFGMGWEAAHAAYFGATIFSLGGACVAMLFDRIGPPRPTLGPPPKQRTYLVALAYSMALGRSNDRIAVFGVPLVTWPFVSLLIFVLAWLGARKGTIKWNWARVDWMYALGVTFGACVFTVIFAFATSKLRYESLPRHMRLTDAK